MTHTEKKTIKIHSISLPIVAIPAPRNISTMPRISARQACHRHRDVILPRTTCTFQVAPDAGWALRTGGPSDMFRRLCHCGFTPRACIPTTIPTMRVDVRRRCSDCGGCFCLHVYCSTYIWSANDGWCGSSSSLCRGVVDGVGSEMIQTYIWLNPSAHRTRMSLREFQRPLQTANIPSESPN